MRPTEHRYQMSRNFIEVFRGVVVFVGALGGGLMLMLVVMSLRGGFSEIAPFVVSFICYVMGCMALFALCTIGIAVLDMADHALAFPRPEAEPTKPGPAPVPSTPLPPLRPGRETSRAAAIAAARAIKAHGGETPRDEAHDKAEAAKLL